MYCRFVGVAVTILGFTLLISNLTEIKFDTWVWVWIVIAGFAGIAGGILFLLAYDGPIRFRDRRKRVIAWSLMLGSVALPTSLTLMLVPLVLLTLPAAMGHDEVETPATSG